jgi:hypothetical protein
MKPAKRESWSFPHNMLGGPLYATKLGVGVGPTVLGQIERFLASKQEI